MSGLVQLLTSGGPQNSYITQGGQPLASFDFKEIDFHSPVGFRKNLSSVIQRHGDVLEDIQFCIRATAAPAGWRWKRCWPLHFLKKVELCIGGQCFWLTTSEQLRLKHLIHPSETAPELLFDYADASERTELSSLPHEVWVEPLPLKTLINIGKGIPMVALAFHEVRINVQTTSLMDCLEPIDSSNAPALDLSPDIQNSFLNNFLLVANYTYLDNGERQQVANSQHSLFIKNFTFSETDFQRNGQDYSRFKLFNEGLCSAAYLWITDEDGNELPNTVLEALKVQCNGHNRHELSAAQMRHLTRNHLPHSTLPNNISKNLYYIPYWPHRTNPKNGVEQGLHLSRIDNYTWGFHWANTAPANTPMRIHILHRIQNEIRIMSGMAGLGWAISDFGGIQHTTQNPAVGTTNPSTGASGAVADPTPIQLPDVKIDIGTDEVCMIWHSEFEEGVAVARCHECKKFASLEALRSWFRSAACNKTASCPNCRAQKGFDYGKAHLLP